MSSNCSLAEELYDLAPLQALQWINITTSVASVALVVYTARRHLRRTIFENVTKELIIALYMFIVIYSVCLILTQGSQLVYRYIAREKWDAQVPKIWCVFRYILTFITFSFAMIHVGITAQHLLSSLGVCIRMQTIVTRVSILISAVVPIIYCILAYSKDSLTGRTAYCSGFTANSAGVLMFNLNLVFILDVLSTIVSLLLWKYNLHKLESEQSFDLSISFHRRQNLYAMQQFAPIAALQAVIYAVFFVTVHFSQGLQSMMSPGWYTFTSAASNIIFLYCFLCPLLLLLLIRRGKFQRAAHVSSMINPAKNSKDVYFGALQDQWK